MSVPKRKSKSKSKGLVERVVSGRDIDQFSTMALRIAQTQKMLRGMKAVHGRNELSMAERALVEKMGKVYKGSRSMFDRQCRPDVVSLMEHFHGPYLEEALAIVFKGHTPPVWRDKRWRGVKEEDPCFGPLNSLDYPSLHDGHIQEWKMEGDTLTVLFDGYFSETGLTDGGFLEARFHNPAVDVILLGERGTLSQEAMSGQLVKTKGFLKNGAQVKAQRAFARCRKGGKVYEQGFDQLSWIHGDERSLEGEPLSWKILFGSNMGRGMELGITFDRLEITHGMGAIQARRDAVALASSLDSAVPVPTAQARQRL